MKCARRLSPPAPERQTSNNFTAVRGIRIVPRSKRARDRAIHAPQEARNARTEASDCHGHRSPSRCFPHVRPSSEQFGDRPRNRPHAAEPIRRVVFQRAQFVELPYFFTWETRDVTIFYLNRSVKGTPL